MTHETALPNVRPILEAFSVAVPPEGLGSVGAMQHVMPSVYVTPVTSSALLMLHVTVFGVSTTTGTAAWSANWYATVPLRTLTTDSVEGTVSDVVTVTF